jgi:two-component system phosphate regulon sensor histidine kinase PhoR
MLTAFIFVSSYYLKQNNIKVFTEDLQSTGLFLQPYISDLYLAGKTAEIDQKLKTNKDNFYRITLIDREGRVLADSHVDINAMENHLNRQEVKEMFEDGYSVALRRSSTLKEKLLYVALPIYKDGQIDAALRINTQLRSITLLSKEFFAKNALMLLTVLLLALISAYLFSGLLAARITELGRAFAKLSAGDLTARAHISGGDELEELGENFNLMSQNMADIIKVKEHSRAELSGVIESVNDIVLVIKKDGLVALSNQKDYPGKYYWEIHGLAILNKYIGKTNNAELEIDGKYYSCSIAPIKNTANIVAVMHDITQIKNLQKIKNDFISNMSHELKTPLASIKAYLELIAGESDETAKKEYLGVIQRNAERLANITNDILLLSSLEDKKRLRPAQFNLQEVFKEADTLLAQKAQSKGLELNFHEGDANINADKFYIEQMLINLVDNAIRYTETGRIDIEAEQDDFGTKITVADTGIGISKEHQQRIFERFFVADKSRSKRSGGTGLGLAIVKHIAEAHGGKVSLKSEPGQGTTFIVRLP